MTSVIVPLSRGLKVNDELSWLSSRYPAGPMVKYISDRSALAPG